MCGTPDAADLAVVIVNFNSGGYLDTCLASLRPSLEGLRWRAVVVDNASSDESELAATRHGPAVSMLRATTNMGFACAANLGARSSASRLLLFLNPDCRLAPGTIRVLLEEIDRNEANAAVAPAVLNEDGSPQGNARGDPSMLTGLFGRSTWLTRAFPAAPASRHNVVQLSDLPPGEVARDVDWVSGACVLVRRAAFDAVSGFDERYFLYWEDADLCRRLRAATWKIRFVPGVSVVHTGARSSRTVPALAVRAFHQSAYLYYATHIASSPWNPKRWIAGVLLSARCAIRLSRTHSAGIFTHSAGMFTG